MDITTLDGGFFKKDTIDEFESAIWTERYFGDGDFELSVPATEEMLDVLPKDQMMWCKGSIEPMILETRDVENGFLKTTGITITKWLNNRFIRTSADPKIKDWQFSKTPGDALRHIVQEMCCSGSTYLDGTIPIGIPVGTLTRFIVPGLQAITTDFSGAVVDFSVPYGPVYDALNQIATTYEIGMSTHLDSVSDESFTLTFESYKGVDRTSAQSVNPVIQFSAKMDTFTNIHDLESVTDHRNLTFIFISNAPGTYAAGPGLGDAATGIEGFNLRAFQGWADNVNPEGLTDAQILALLNQQAQTELKAHKVVKLVDGEIVQVDGVEYGTDFFMGDLVEVVGNLGTLQTARVTEYIRTQDAAGERSYPGLTFLD